MLCVHEYYDHVLRGAKQGVWGYTGKSVDNEMV